MSEENTVDYGPLTALIGTWQGNKGMDIAPEPDDTERSPYYETIVFEAAGTVTNAEEQTLAVVRYHQRVFRSSNDVQFHDQVGYWTWDAATGEIANTFTIPRRVAVVAGGDVIDESADSLTLRVKATDDDAGWSISQAPFMRDKARSKSYSQTLTISGDQLSYEQTTVLDIYGSNFDHTDKSVLARTSR